MRYREGVFFDGNGFPVCLTAMPSRRCGCFSGIGRGAGVMDDFSLCDFGGMAHGFRGACGVRRAVCGLPVSAPVSGAMSFPVFVCRCRVVAGVESAWSCLRACQSGLRFCRVPVPRSLTGRVLPPFSGLRVPVGAFVPRSGMCRDMRKYRSRARCRGWRTAVMPAGQKKAS